MESKAKGIVPRYNQFVLEGTWIDDRSTLPPSIVADQGYRLYTTKAQEDYGKAPDLKQEVTYPRFRPRYGMLTAHTWNEASYSYGGGPEALKRVLLGGKKGFQTTCGGREMTKEEVAATFTTTARQAAISGIQVSSSSAEQAAANTAQLAKTSLMPGAGGAAFLNPTDKGKAIRGVSGEIIRESADARYDSQAQRSWIGKPDAGLGVSRRVRNQHGPPLFLSLSLFPHHPFHFTLTHTHTHTPHSRLRRGRTSLGCPRRVLAWRMSHLARPTAPPTTVNLRPMPRRGSLLQISPCSLGGQGRGGAYFWTINRDFPPVFVTATAYSNSVSFPLLTCQAAISWRLSILCSAIYGFVLQRQCSTFT